MKIKLELSTGKVLELTEEEDKELRNGNKTVYVPYQRPCNWGRDGWAYPHPYVPWENTGSVTTTNNVGAYKGVIETNE